MQQAGLLKNNDELYYAAQKNHPAELNTICCHLTIKGISLLRGQFCRNNSLQDIDKKSLPSLTF